MDTDHGSNPFVASRLMAPWRMHLLTGIFGLITICLVAFGFNTVMKMAVRRVPRVDAIMEIKFEATAAHLCLEEAIHNRRPKKADAIWQHLDQADWYARAILEGGSNPEGTFVALKNVEVRDDVKHLQERLAALRTASHQRLAIGETSPSGQEAVRQYDAAFADLIEQANDIEARIKVTLADDLRDFYWMQWVLLALCLLLWITAGLAFHWFERRRAAAIEEVNAANDLLALEIAERKQAEVQLQQERDYSAQIINSLPGLFYVFDEERFVQWNPLWEKITGYSSDELAKLYGPDFFEGADKTLIVERMQDVFREGFSEAEASLITKDGRRIPYFFTGARCVFDGKPHLVGLGIDITQLKAAAVEREKLIAKLEAQNAELERFTYTVSHDLKSPLITIKGFVGMLRDDIAKNGTEAVESDILRISSAADKMARLLSDLLELSRIGRLANPPQSVPLGELCKEALELTGGQIEENGVRVEIAPDLPVVFGDRTRLLEVLQNLIDNAIKYRGDQARPRVEIGSRRDGEETVFYVRDNGMGIDHNYMDKVFGLFEQLDPKMEGSGIGLALVRRIIEVHGGRIWVESEGAGQGSTFCFTLPDGDAPRP